jgi:hypothetical protein
MVNAVNVPSQTVAVNGTVLFGSTRIKTGCSVRHEQGSGRFVAREPGVYEVSFAGNVTGATATTPIALALYQDGELIAGSQMTYTPATAGAVGNVSKTVLARVFCDCCSSISVRNVGTTAIQLDNANMTITRES